MSNNSKIGWEDFKLVAKCKWSGGRKHRFDCSWFIQLKIQMKIQCLENLTGVK